jgi:hypothetical protein
MKHFRRIFSGLDVAPALAQLDAHPELWGEHPERIKAPNSPHAQSQDVWLRFRPEAELHEPADYGAPHFAVFWPAWWLLPGLHAITYDVMRAVEATYLGGCLITRIPAGKQILPHVDKGWHPAWNDTKAYVILAANPGCVNRCGEEDVVMREGEAWIFRNDILHSVQNWGSTDRIALILTMKTERSP